VGAVSLKLTDLPYVNAYGKLATLFTKIKEASVPPKFTQDYLSASLGLTSSSDRAFPNLLKRLGFIDGSGVPTEAYREYRDDTKSKGVMAEQLRKAYADLFKVNEYVYKLAKNELVAKVKQVTGLGETDSSLGAIVGTFSALRELSDFETTMIESLPKEDKRKAIEISEPSQEEGRLKLGMSYTIVLNLPATSDIAVFNAIFKSLKDTILKE
jgi:hypothetical protein